MTVSNNNGTLRVILSEAETIHYGIDDIFFEEDCSNSKTALKNLLKSAARTVGFFADTLQFLIEIYPDLNGGCEVFFIPTHHKSNKRLKAVKSEPQKKRIVAEFPDGEGVLSVCKNLFSKKIITENQLFKFKGCFRLVLLHTPQTENVLKEYTDQLFTSKIELAKTTEYGKEICKDAIRKIGNALK